MLKMANGDRYEAVHMFKGEMRAIVNVEGLYVFADRIAPDGWELSGEPARPGDELEMLNALVRATEAAGTTVKVTDPDGNTTTFVDGES